MILIEHNSVISLYLDKCICLNYIFNLNVPLQIEVEINFTVKVWYSIDYPRFTLCRFKLKMAAKLQTMILAVLITFLFSVRLTVTGFLDIEELKSIHYGIDILNEPIMWTPEVYKLTV